MLIYVTLPLHEMYYVYPIRFNRIWDICSSSSSSWGPGPFSVDSYFYRDSRKPFGKQYKGYKGNGGVVVAGVRVQSIHGLDLRGQLEGGEPLGGIIHLVLRNDHSPILQLSLVYCLDHG